MAAKTAPRLRLGRGAHLKQVQDFLRTRHEGSRMVLGCMIANWRCLPEGSRSRLGVITTRKLGNAVARNRARRLMREAFRVHQHELKMPVDLVLVARPSMADKTFGAVETDFLTTLRKAGLLKAARPRE